MNPKKLCLLLLATISFAGYSQNAGESPATTFQLSGNLLLTNNGISPIPAFSLNKPALMTSLSLKKDRFSFDPEFNYALDATPWTIDTWLHYSIPVKRWTFKSGVNLSHFFDRQVVDASTPLVVTRLNRYFVVQEIVSYKPTENISISGSYWNIMGADDYAVRRGHFAKLEAAFTNVKLFRVINTHFKPLLFFIKNSSPIEGWFASATVEFGYKNIPLFLATQVIQPLSVTPETKFNWNTGLKYYF